jgi:hypothetical protein
MNIFAFYTVEFLPSGKVLPNPPAITVSRFDDDEYPAVDIALVFVFYFLAEEIQELVLHGPKWYLASSGPGNLVDLVAIATTFTMAVQRYVTVGMTTSRSDAHYWSLASAQGDMGIVAGVAMFTVVMKLLKFTKNVPIMCRITDTFSDVAMSISIFLVVMGIFFLAFGMLFNMIFSLNMSEFSELGKSVFSIFRAMNGDIDVDKMAQVQPIWGPVFYCLFVTATVFVAFTILIAIIADSYENVKENEPSEGVIVSIQRRLQGWLAMKTEDKDEQLDPMVAMQQKIDELHELIINQRHLPSASVPIQSQENPLPSMGEAAMINH